MNGRTNAVSIESWIFFFVSLTVTAIVVVSIKTV